ncbi:hypothetical protein AC249_AIPGENE18524 [Exaiptasia diaphana]|nr:hypothetical protein AC249_AIPGENE18524 [Exaiptasia diaphana]
MISCGVYANVSALDPHTVIRNIKKILFTYVIDLDNSFSNEKCDCPKKCKQIQYKTTGINVMSLMSESYWKDYTEMILKKYSTVPQHLTESEFK